MHRCPSGAPDPADAIPRRRRERCPGRSGAGSHTAPEDVACERFDPAAGRWRPRRWCDVQALVAPWRAGLEREGLAPGDRGSAEGLSRSCAGARGQPPPRALDDRRRPADADVQAEAPKAGGALRKGDPGAVPGTLGRRVRRRVGWEPGRRAERGARLVARFSADAALVPPPLRRAGPSVRPGWGAGATHVQDAGHRGRKLGTRRWCRQGAPAPPVSLARR